MRQGVIAKNPFLKLTRMSWSFHTDTRFYEFPRQYGILIYGKERTTVILCPVTEAEGV